MKILDIKDKKNLPEIVEFFLAEKVVAYPTDTTYGLGCVASSDKAIRKIIAIKKRKEKKGLIVLVKSYCMAKDYFKISKKQEEFLRTVWPKISADARKTDLKYKIKPSTVIMNSKSSFFKKLTFDDSGAVRLPHYKELVTIIKQVKIPIVSTSLNISGQRTLTNISAIKKKFSTQIDLLLIDDDFKPGQSSRVFDIRDINNVKQLR